MKRFSVLTLLAFAGCYSAELEAPRSVPADVGVVAERFRPLGDFDVPGSERYKGEDPDVAAARIELLDSVTDYLDAVRNGVESGTDWQERSRLVRQVMDDPEMTEPQSWFVDQIGASIVLEGILDQRANDRSEGAKEAVGEFVEILVDRESPNAPLIAGGLDFLRGHWPAERIRTLAARAADDATAYLEDCEACGPTTRSYKDTRPAADLERRMIVEGVTRLVELSRVSE